MRTSILFYPIAHKRNNKRHGSFALERTDLIKSCSAMYTGINLEAKVSEVKLVPCVSFLRSYFL